MHYTIESSAAKAVISGLGAELQSLCINTGTPSTGTDNDANTKAKGNTSSTDNLAGNCERLWQGDPTVWAGRAPILFPIVGALKNNQYLYQGKSYTLPRHGIARHAEFACIEHTTDRVTLRLTADADSLSVYPWQFELTVSFSMQQTKLLVQYAVTNQDTKPMFFTIGSHPAFALDRPPSEYYIEFSEAETLQRFPLTTDGLLTSGVDYLQDCDRLGLSDTLFDDDALIFKNIQSRSISLYHQDTPIVTVDTGGAPHLGLWAKPAARFVCIEPWFGFSDDADSPTGTLEDKPEMKQLATGELFNYEWNISLHRS